MSESYNPLFRLPFSIYFVCSCKIDGKHYAFGLCRKVFKYRTGKYYFKIV